VRGCVGGGVPQRRRSHRGHQGRRSRGARVVHAARLGSPTQLERLRRFYPDHFAERPFGAVDVYVVLRDAPTAGTRPELLELAKNLARELARDTEVRDHVRRIACIAARTGTEPVRFDARFAYGAGCPDRA